MCLSSPPTGSEIMFFHRNPAPEFLNVGFLNQGIGCMGGSVYTGCNIFVLPQRRPGRLFFHSADRKRNSAVGAPPRPASVAPHPALLCPALPRLASSGTYRTVPTRIALPDLTVPRIARGMSEFENSTDD